MLGISSTKSTSWPCDLYSLWRLISGGWSSGVNSSVTLGMDLRKVEVYPWGRKSPSGVQGRRPNRGSSGRTPPIWYLFWKWM